MHNCCYFYILYERELKKDVCKYLTAEQTTFKTGLIIIITIHFSKGKGIEL